MKETRLAGRYAKALLDFAIEMKEEERVFADMTDILSVSQQNRDFQVMLCSPVIKTSKKLSVFKAIFTHIHPISLKYFETLLKNKRERLLTAIAEEFISQYKCYRGIKQIDITTSEPLNETTRTLILEKLKQLIPGQLELREKVNPSLIGGFVISTEGKQFDTSILRKMKKLQKNFSVNIFEKGF